MTEQDSAHAADSAVRIALKLLESATTFASPFRRSCARPDY